MSLAYDPFAALNVSVSAQKLDKQKAIADMLTEAEPQTVRRVLPRELIERQVKFHLQELQVMMKSFEAILTFPTAGRKLPQAVLAKMQKQLGGDLRNASDKLATEVKELLDKVKTRQVLQANIMCDVVAASPLPFCLLNDVVYHPKRSRYNENKIFVPAYVILWASQPKKGDSIHVWLELLPHNPDQLKMLSPQELRSEEYIVHAPAGEVSFSAFQTAVSVNLYGIPSEMEATLAGKNYQQLLDDYQRLRTLLVRRKDDSGDFLHFVWRHNKGQQEVDQGFLV